MAVTLRGTALTLHLHKNHELVTTMANVAGAFTPVFVIKPGAKQILRWPNGNPIRMKLYTSDGTELPESTEIMLVKRYADGYTTKVIGRTLYQYWKLTSLENQGDPRRMGFLTIPFIEDADLVEFGHGEALEIHIKSSAVVDWNYAGTVLYVSVGEKVKQEL